MRRRGCKKYIMNSHNWSLLPKTNKLIESWTDNDYYICSTCNMIKHVGLGSGNMVYLHQSDNFFYSPFSENGSYTYFSCGEELAKDLL